MKREKGEKERSDVRFSISFALKQCDIVSRLISILSKCEAKVKEQRKGQVLKQWVISGVQEKRDFCQKRRKGEKKKRKRRRFKTNKTRTVCSIFLYAILSYRN